METSSLLKAKETFQLQDSPQSTWINIAMWASTWVQRHRVFVRDEELANCWRLVKASSGSPTICVPLGQVI